MGGHDAGKGGGNMRSMKERVGTVLVSVATVAAVWAIAIPAQAAGATCHGKTATIVGTKGSNRIKGTSGRDVIQAKGGNGKDKVYGSEGMDAISGGSGRDRLWGNGGPDQLAGQAGNDWLFGGHGLDQGNGGAGVDVCRNVEQRVSC
jgi:Ca2+-binding RTX toxin-like protein